MISKYYHVDVEKIERLLIAKGWSASRIAETGVVSQRTINKIMTNPDHRVFRSSLKRLADVFGVKPEEIIRDGPYSRVDKSAKTTFDIHLSNLPEDFDETSMHLHWFFDMLKSQLGGWPIVVDYDDSAGRVKITIEIDVSSLPEMFCLLTNKYFKQVKPHGPPGTIQPGAVPIATILWWVDEISFPDDCPLKILRSRHLYRKNNWSISKAELKAIPKDMLQDYEEFKKLRNNDTHQ